MIGRAAPQPRRMPAAQALHGAGASYIACSIPTWVEWFAGGIGRAGPFTPNTGR